MFPVHQGNRLKLSDVTKDVSTLPQISLKELWYKEDHWDIININMYATVCKVKVKPKSLYCFTFNPSLQTLFEATLPSGGEIWEQHYKQYNPIYLCPLLSE